MYAYAKHDYGVCGNVVGVCVMCLRVRIELKGSVGANIGYMLVKGKQCARGVRIDWVVYLGMPYDQKTH